MRYALILGLLLLASEAQAQVTYDLGGGVYMTPQTYAPSVPPPVYVPAPAYPVPYQAPVVIQTWPQPMAPHYGNQPSLPKVR